MPPGIALEICLFFNKFLKFSLFLKSLEILSFSSEDENESNEEIDYFLSS